MADKKVHITAIQGTAYDIVLDSPEYDHDYGPTTTVVLFDGEPATLSDSEIKWIQEATEDYREVQEFLQHKILMRHSQVGTGKSI